jgi:heme exporter protein D
MNWGSAAEFWRMGGAAPFVWGSYGLTLVLVVAELVLLFRRRRDTVARLIRWRRANAGRAPRAANPEQ